MPPPPLPLRLFRVTVALAATVGGVLLLRTVGRDLLRVPQPLLPTPTQQPAPAAHPTTRYALKDLIPATAQLTFAGIAPIRTQQQHDIPLSLAQTILPAQYQARGWTRVNDLPPELQFTLDLRGIQVWLTPQHDYVQIHLEAIDPQHTRERTFRLSTKAHTAQPHPVPIMPLTEAQRLDQAHTRMRRSAEAAQLHRQLPPWMAALCLGPILSSQLITRPDGATYYLTTSTTAFETPSEALHAVMRSALAHGWRVHPLPPLGEALDSAAPGATEAPGAGEGAGAFGGDGSSQSARALYSYGNLLCFIRGHRTATGLALTYRFSDDEAELPPPPSPNVSNP